MTPDDWNVVTMKAVKQINELDRPAMWHRWLALAITMPFRVLLLVIGLPIILMLCVEDEDFRKFWPGIKKILIDRLELE